MDLTFFSSNQVQVVFVGVEVETHTSSKAVGESFLLVVKKFLLLVDDELELDDLLGLKFVLHKVPVGDTAIGGDGVEVQVLSSFLGLPAHLPHGVGMLGCSDGGLVNGLVVLVADIKHHDGTIVASSSD